MFKKAVKHEAKLRMAISGPSGSGKTYSALAVAVPLAGDKRVALVDTEHGSASKYADLFDFDVVEFDNFHPDNFSKAIKAAIDAGYGAIILDSLSHAWNGKGGLLSLVDKFTKQSSGRDTFGAGWKKATPIQDRFVESIVGSPIHIIATIRSKQAYERTKDDRGKTVILKLGMAPIQRDGFEYEFDIFLNMDQDNNAIVSKSRCPALTGQVINKPDAQLADTLAGWLNGEQAPKVEAHKVATEPEPEATEDEPTPGDKLRTEQAAKKTRAALTPEKLRDALQQNARVAEDKKHTLARSQRAMIAPNLESLFSDKFDTEERRRDLTNFLFEVSSTGTLTEYEAYALSKWMKVKPTGEKKENGKAIFAPDPVAVKEAAAVIDAIGPEATWHNARPETDLL